MHRFIPVLSCLFPGLLTAAILGFVQIRHSMAPVLLHAEGLQAQGILSVPHGAAIPIMAGLKMGLFPALFFLLSIGAGLATASFALAWSSRNLVGDSRWISLPASGLWLGLFIFINHRGAVLFPSLWVLLVPAITWKASLALMPKTTLQDAPWHKPAHLVPLVLLALAAAPLLGKSVFMDIRDSLLLSSRLGLAISDAYYLYTLPAAEAIKPVAARQMKLYATDLSLDTKTEENLRLWGWHRAEPGTPHHVRLHAPGASLVLSGEAMGKSPLTWSDFTQAPGQILDEISLKADRMGPFRSLILLCLVTGFPLLLYTLIFSPLRRILAWIFDRPTASCMASILCLTLGLGGLLPLYFLGEARRGFQDPESLSRYLVSEKRSERLHALRTAAKGRKIMVPETLLSQILEKGDTAERYWTVTLLGAKPSENHWNLLLHALTDPHPNVLCKTLEALSRSAPKLHKNEEARRVILHTLQNSAHPYVQWYAFEALKRLGPLPSLSFQEKEGRPS